MAWLLAPCSYHTHGRADPKPPHARLNRDDQKAAGMGSTGFTILTPTTSR
jgi:hypothetical protein